MAVRKVDTLINNAKQICAVSRSGGPIQCQATFDWKRADKYQELHSVEIQLRNIFMTNNYNTQDSKSVPIILNWLDQERLTFVQRLNDGEQERCQAKIGLFELLSDKFKPQCNETMLPL